MTSRIGPRFIVAIAIAPLLGLWAFLSRTIASWPTAMGRPGFFEAFADASENASRSEFIRFGGVGLALGLLAGGGHLLLGRMKVPAPVLLGIASVAALPVISLIDTFIGASGSTHNLLPFEFVVHAFYGALVMLGALLPYAVVVLLPELRKGS